MKSGGILALLAMTVCSGCAFQSQAVKITPEVKSISTVSGEGRNVRLTVLDERPSSVIGQRGVGGAGADMTIDGDLKSIVSNAVSSGLSQRRFSTQGTGESADLRVEIRGLDSKNIMGFWSGTLRDEFSMKGICKSSKGASYEQMYNGKFEKSIQVVPTGEANDKYISAAVSDAVNKLVSDDALLRCLSQ